ncbi:MAG: Transport system permease protein [uncultured bacterium]|nr:MAG: Transport system permease protein [uncultured bacterium]
MLFQRRFSQFQLIIIMISAACFSILYSLSKGSTPASLYQLFFDQNEQIQAILFNLRLPRTLTAFVSGALLALAGALMQLLLQNPLADPYVLGISGGAALFTLILMLLGASSIILLGGAWLGSLLSILLILFFARKHRFEPHALLLCGIALACGFSAGISFLLLISPDANLRSMLFWLAGDLNDARYPWDGLIILFLGFCFCLILAPGFNILSRGINEARALGLSTSTYRVIIYFLSALFTASAVTMVGSVGFIGLLIPHLSRILMGCDHRISLPITALLGGMILTIADTFARTLFAPQQLPVGILLALIGVPIFLWRLSV